MTGRSAAPSVGFDGVTTHFSRFCVVAPLAGVPVTRIISGCNATNYGALDTSGKLWIWGRNDKGQCGVAHNTNVYIPKPAVGVPPVADATFGKAHALIVGTDGSLWATGEGRMGQTGLGEGRDVMKWTRVKNFNLTASAATPADGVMDNASAPHWISAAVGLEFSLALDSSGRVFSCGSMQYGQCGNGRTGETIKSAGKLMFGVVSEFTRVRGGLEGKRIVAIGAGATHGVALDDEGVAYSWGDGGYGRLGHGDNKDSFIPRCIKVTELPRMRVASLTTGSCCNYYTMKAATALFMSGITKKSGEANMIPKAIIDMSGWLMRSVACGMASTIVASDASCVTWGSSPVFGELGHGEEFKSVARPKKVEDLEGCHVIQVAAGLAVSLALVDTTSETKVT